MLEALKKIDRKFLIIIGIIIFAPIFLILILLILRGCGNTKIDHYDYEQKMISAAQKYVSNKKIELKEGKSVSIDLNDLVDLGYIKSTEKLLDDSSCSGNVIVRKNGSLIEENDGGYINYIPNLKCSKYKSQTLKDLIMEDLTSSKSGLYLQGDSYVFKGDEVNNYITFYGKTYRIIGMDKNGLVKLIRVDESIIDRYWDIKYNSQTNDASGKNIYADSEIFKNLIEYYNDNKKISKEAKQHIVANDVCIGARDVQDISISTENECSEVLENQVISLMGVTDYAKASLDPECDSIVSKSCRNYNYMKGLFLDSWTLTPVLNSTYEVYYTYNGVVKYQAASKYTAYNIIIHIDGNEIVLEGDGSEDNPYIIK